MGCGPFRVSRDSYPKTRNIVTNNNVTINNIAPQNPNPANYEIIRYHEYNYHLIVEIKYPDCTNYEGRKILLYKNTSLKQLLKQKLIDPHFSKNKKYKSPFARFEPTVEGWKAAYFFMDDL